MSERFKATLSGFALVALYFLALLVVLFTAIVLVRLFWWR